MSISEFLLYLFYFVLILGVLWGLNPRRNHPNKKDRP